MLFIHNFKLHLFYKTPLIAAIEIQNARIVELLLNEKRVDVNANDYMQSAVFSAIDPYYKIPNNEIVELLLKREDLNYNVKDKKIFKN